MRQLLLLAILSTLAPLTSAAVIRCADAAGNVSYTDGACPPGASPVGRVSEPPPPVRGAAERQREERGPTAAGPSPSQAPAGPAIIDSRGTGSDERPGDSRWSDRGGSDPVVIDDGYPYPGTYRQPVPPRDMRPRIRNCDAAGCQDRQGNHYDRSGRLDRYQTPDGKTCRPVGTTTICR
jgi:hypothetical protein